MTAWIRLPELLRATLPGLVAADTHPYRVLRKAARFEIRAYRPCFVVETLVPNTDDSAVQRGYQILSDCLSESASRLEMLAAIPLCWPYARPVMQSDCAEGLAVTLIVPSGLDVEAIPFRQHPCVNLRKVAAHVVACTTYSGCWSARNDALHLRQLRRSLLKEGIQAHGTPTFARYNSPFSAPFTRRNEAWLRLL
jgi:hypothetical protein